MANRQRVRRLAGEVGVIAAGQMLSVLGSLVQVRVLTEYLVPTQYGALALGLTFAVLVNQTITGAVGNGIGRFYAVAVEEAQFPQYLSASLRTLEYSSVLVLCIFGILVAGAAILGLASWIGLICAALFYALVSGFNSALSAIQNAARQRGVVAFHSGADAWLRMGLSVVLFSSIARSSTVAIMAYGLSALLVSGSQVLFLRCLIRKQNQNTSFHVTRNWLHEIWRFSWPYSSWGIFTWVQLSSDKWSLQAFASSASVGGYAVLFQLGYTPISIATNLTINFLGPVLYQRAGDGTDARRNAIAYTLIWKVAAMALGLTAFAFLFAMVAHRWLFSILVATPYRALSNLLPWMVLSGGLFAVGQLFFLKLAAEKLVVQSIPLKIGTAIVGTLFNILGAACFGMRGVVIGIVGFSIVYLAWTVILCRANRFSVYLQCELQHRLTRSGVSSTVDTQ